MTNPVVDLVGDQTGRIVPVYPQSEKAGLDTWDLACLIEEALRGVAIAASPTRCPTDRSTRGSSADPRRLGDPQARDDPEKDQARRRLVFDELLRVQLELVRRKRRIEETRRTRPHGRRRVWCGGSSTAPVSAHRGPAAVIGEIVHDLAGSNPMHRLLQGDVGSGKTVVAGSPLLAAVQGGHQGALMAPTEVLAEQHSPGCARCSAI